MLGSIRRGDTLIEVLFAVTIFSLVAVGSLSIMNQGSATAQRALEITMASQEIDSQAQTLRFLNSSYIAAYQPGITYPPSTPAGEWSAMLAALQTQASAFGATGTDCPSLPVGSFILDTHNAAYVNPSGGALVPANTYAQVTYTTIGGHDTLTQAQGVWIEAVLSPPAVTVKYIDFHVRACWDSPGQSAPVTLGTIVRLYEP